MRLIIYELVLITVLANAMEDKVLSKADLLQLWTNRRPMQLNLLELDPEGDILEHECSKPINLEHKAHKPFSKSGLVEDPNSKEWVYIDDEGKLQGPFSTNEMDSWFEEGFLDSERLVGLNHRDRLLPLWMFMEMLQCM